MHRMPRASNTDISAYKDRIIKVPSKQTRTYREVVIAYKRGRTLTIQAQERNRRALALESAEAFTGEKFQRPKKGTGL
jgi:hypothetical protein